METILFTCNVCQLEFPLSDKAKRNKRCIECHRQKEKERRLLDWRQIEVRREKYKERAKIIKKEYRENNKEKLSERRKINREKKIIEELTEEGVKAIHEKWILFNIKHPGRHITDGLSAKQKRKIMNCYEEPI